MSKDVDLLVEAFRDRLTELEIEDPKLIHDAVALNADEVDLVERDDHLLSHDSVARRDRELRPGRRTGVYQRMARRVAEQLVAPVRWRDAIGPVIDTWEVANMLDISRQAIADRVRHHSLLAVPGRRSRLYPYWQFDTTRREVREVVPTLLRRWYSAEPDVDAVTIATWANTPSELLHNAIPSRVIAEGDDALVLAAADVVIAQRTR